MVRLGGIIARFSKNSRRTFVIAGLMLFFEAVTATLIPLLVASIIDYMSVRLSQMGGQPVSLPASPIGFLGLRSLMGPDAEAVLFVTLGIVGMTMINRFGNSLAEVSLVRGGRRVGYNLRSFLYAHLQKLSLTFYSQNRTGDLLSRLTSDVAAVEDFMISDLSGFLKSVLLILFILVSMFINAWQVAVVAAFMIPVMAWVSLYYMKRIQASFQKLSDSDSELASTAQEMMTSIQVVQTYGQARYEQSLFSSEGQRSMNSAVEAATYEARLDWMVNVIGAVFTVAVIWMGVYLTFRNPAGLGSIGLLAAYITYMQELFEPTQLLIQEWSTYSELSTSLDGIGEIMELQPAVTDSPGATQAPLFHGQLEFRDVDFAYPAADPSNEGARNERTLLKNLNFAVQPGQVIGVVGNTGAGKSTLIQLIPRLYDPNAGQILIDGHDIREYTLESLRAQISLVLQETLLFSGSILENIAYGHPEATGAEIIAAAKQAGADEFISRLPDGYFTILGERGLNLSEGQRQRIAIARAFIRNTPFLILDEPTSRLDAESTEIVMQTLHQLMKGKTTVMITQKIDLIQTADKILVLKGGKIEQMGTHAELTQAGGFYADLYKLQSGRGNAFADSPSQAKIAGG
jgi:ABC-type multidrug transport system fused ATPase/permease subunit